MIFGIHIFVAAFNSNLVLFLFLKHITVKPPHFIFHFLLLMLKIYRLIETTGLSRGEIKKWFSEQRLLNLKGM